MGLITLLRHPPDKPWRFTRLYKLSWLIFILGLINLVTLGVLFIPATIATLSIPVWGPLFWPIIAWEPYIDPQEIAKLEYDLELTPSGKEAATERMINDIDRQLAEAGVVEAQIAYGEKLLQTAVAIPSHQLGPDNYQPVISRCCDCHWGCTRYCRLYDDPEWLPMSSGMIHPMDSPVPIRIVHPPRTVRFR